LTDLSDFGVQIQSIKDSARRGLTGCDRLNRVQQFETVLMRRADGYGAAYRPILRSGDHLVDNATRNLLGDMPFRTSVRREHRSATA
jgi:hypothetical protein